MNRVVIFDPPDFGRVNGEWVWLYTDWGGWRFTSRALGTSAPIRDRCHKIMRALREALWIE